MAKQIKTNAPAAVETVALNLTADMALNAFDGAAVTASKAVVDMIISGSLVFLIGKHLGTEKTKAVELDKWSTTMEDHLRKSNPDKAPSTLFSYIATARKLYAKITDTFKYGGIVDDIRKAKDMDAARAILTGWLTSDKGAKHFKASNNLDGLKLFVGVAASNATVKVASDAAAVLKENNGIYKPAINDALERSKSSKDAEVKAHFSKVASKLQEQQKAAIDKNSIDTKVKEFVANVRTENAKDDAKPEVIGQKIAAQMPMNVAVSAASATVSKITTVTDAEALFLSTAHQLFTIGGVELFEKVMGRASKLAEKWEAEAAKLAKANAPAPHVTKAKGNGRRREAAATH